MPQTTRSRPLRLTQPQLYTLQLLHDGWQCQMGGMEHPHVRPLIWYSLRRHGESRGVVGSTLISLLARAFIVWATTTLPMAIDGSQVPGYTLMLTDIGQRAVPQGNTP